MVLIISEVLAIARSMIQMVYYCGVMTILKTIHGRCWRHLQTCNQTDVIFTLVSRISIEKLVVGFIDIPINEPRIKIHQCLRRGRGRMGDLFSIITFMLSILTGLIQRSIVYYIQIMEYT